MSFFKAASNPSLTAVFAGKRLLRVSIVLLLSAIFLSISPSTLSKLRLRSFLSLSFLKLSKSPAFNLSVAV
jgi:hypothetical protein